MYQALVVDDEKEIRDGLSAWNWKDLNVNVAGSCAHGMEALQFIASNPVDIVITDIRMPFMSGLELMEELNRQYPFIVTILLSGYGEFEYAREGIRMGAADYLLKPVAYDDMANSIRRLTARLDEQNQMQYRLAVLKRKSQQVSRAIRREFLDYLFRSPATADDIEHQGAAGELILNAECYSAAILRMDRMNAGRRPTDRELDLFACSLGILLTRLWDGEGAGYHLVQPETASAFLLAKGPPGRARYETLLKELLKYKSLFRSTFSISAGPAVESPARIHLSMRAAAGALPGTPENAVSVCPPVREAEGPPDVPPQPQAGESDRPDHAVLARARKYIQDNYQRGITIKEVAASVFVSPGYLSALFKQASEPFLKYLTGLRVNRAKQLLEDPRYKIYDIVEMVGYSDPAYFSEVFKRVTGKTPNEYRGHAKPE